MWQHLCMSMLMGLALAIPARGAETQPATDVKSLCAELRSGDSIRQMNAANALGSLGEKAGPAAADLVKLLDAPSLEHQLMMHVVRPSPSLTAMNALLKIGPASTEALAAALKSDKTELRVNAVYVLVRLNVEKNLPILAPAATDSATAVRITLIRHLETVTSREALAMRLAALGDSEAAVRLAAVNGFRRFNPKPDTRYPIPADKRPDNYTLSIVAKAITPVLLQDSDPQIRATAAETLGELRTPTAVPSLIKAVADRDANVRKYAARSLGQLGQRQAVPPLLELLADKEQSVVIAAVSALGELGDPLATKPLIPLLRPEQAPNQRHGSLPAVAAHALGQIGDRRAVIALIEELKGPSDDVSAEAAEALGKICDVRATDPLLNILQTGSKGQSRLLLATVTALGQLREPRAIEPLADLLMSNKGAHGPVIESLKKIAHPRVVVAVADRLVASKPTPRDPFNHGAACPLSDLTGRSFRFDYEGLRKWWQANRQRYVDAAESANHKE